MGEERARLLETLQEGSIVHGVVKNITEYGAFVDLGGIDGLLHITDMAWRRVRHPTEVVQVGQEVDARRRQGMDQGPQLPLPDRPLL
jgi:small subunit ribosomal protein S1